MNMNWFRKRVSAPQTAKVLTAGSDSGPGQAVVQVIEALPDPALIVDTGSIITACNTRATEAFGIDARGRHLSAAIRAPAVLAAVGEALAGRGAHQVDYEVHAPVQRHFDTHVAPIALNGGHAAAVLIVLKDLSREQQIERMRADFVANASHELRTPLAALSGFIETMQGAAKSDPKAGERFLGLMQTQAMRMKRLIDDLLSLSRIEMNEHLRPSATVDLAMATRHAADAMSDVAKQQNCELFLDLENDLQVTGDREELVQVVQNLIENAIKYASSGKRIEVTGRKAGDSIEIAIKDYGPGINAVHIPRLTERFYRVSAQESRLRGGTGLGLAIVKHILNRHQGRLLIASTPGEGSRFAFTLPAASQRV
jgi:two-component system phosphate regulon sensor histidine kinase PhoR